MNSKLAELTDFLNSKSILSSVIPSATLRGWLDITDATTDEIMVALLPIASLFAHAPISHFPVGAVAMGLPVNGVPGQLGNLYLGGSHEFEGEALGFAVHGEQSAANNALLNGEHGLQALAVSAAPCGYCRQFLYEIVGAAKGLQIILVNHESGQPTVISKRPLSDFLPHAFGPADLCKKPNLMHPQTNSISTTSADPFIKAAINGARVCYAPYTGNFVAVALHLSTNATVVGWYSENAAYNPGLTAIQSALSFAGMSNAPSVDFKITRAVLAEQPSATSQHNLTRAVLNSAAPDLALEYIALSSASKKETQ